MSGRRATTFAIVALIAVALPVHLWGLRRDLPYTPEVDEPFLVEPALAIAQTGDWNPRWFGYPGSTVIYPIAAGTRLWHAVVHGGKWLGPDQDLKWRFMIFPGDFYLGARLVSVLYAVGAVALLFVVGRRAFDDRVGMLAAGFALLCPLSLDLARQVRADSAATFFGLAFFAVALRLLAQPTLVRQILLGVAAGLAIATRYIMAFLVPVMLAVDAFLVWRRRAAWRPMLVGLVAVPLAFLVVTPYLVLDPTASASLVQAVGWQNEGHLGADNLSRVGNLWWYLREALPSVVTLPLLAAAVVGLGAVLAQRDPRQLLLIGSAALYLMAISVPALHWERWLEPILPTVWLLAAAGVMVSAHAVGRALGGGRSAERAAAAGIALLLLLGPAARTIAISRLHATPSTRIAARQWLLDNVSPDVLLAQEQYTAPLRNTRFKPDEPFALAEHPLAYYLSRHYRYLIASSAVFSRFEAEPQRYAEQVAFYRTLAERGMLRQEFAPSATRGGPLIRVYELPADG